MESFMRRSAQTALAWLHLARIFQQRSAQFAKAHQWVVTASDDASAVVWDAASGEPLTMPLMHARQIISAVFADNDSAVITTDEMGNQWRWDLQPNRKATSDMPLRRSTP